MNRHLIGDYIHAHIRGYSKYGIAQPNKTPSPAGGSDAYNFMKAKEKILNDFKNKRKSSTITNKKAKQMETAIGNLFGAADPNSTDALMTQCLQTIQSTMNPKSIAN